jgi:S-adenosylmethionine:tRNA ribosyltransferase-isomerase
MRPLSPVAILDFLGFEVWRFGFFCDLSLVTLCTELFDYELPARLIAQTPAACRDQSRLLVVNRAAHTVAHHVFADLPQFLRAGDTLFRNTAAVLPARLHAFRPSGGMVECLLLRPELGEGSFDPFDGFDPLGKPLDGLGALSSSKRLTTDKLGTGKPLDGLGALKRLTADKLRADGTQLWWCLVRPAKKLPVAAIFSHPHGDFRGIILDQKGGGGALVGFTTRTGEPITDIANRLGDVPLPPYIERRGTPDERTADLERYQTVYADRTRQVAAAAPTAGLHFTPGLLAALTAQGVQTADLTLHVGLGTFQPIATDTVEAHAIHHEIYELPIPTQRALFPPRAGRRIAVGTTSVRAIEDFLESQTGPTDHPCIAEADIFIHPPRVFRGVNALITNFHQPRSTLLCLVAAFLTPGSTDGIAWLKEIYAEAIAREYRFFSYGDAMLIL